MKPRVAEYAESAQLSGRVMGNDQTAPCQQLSSRKPGRDGFGGIGEAKDGALLANDKPRCLRVPQVFPPEVRPELPPGECPALRVRFGDVVWVHRRSLRSKKRSPRGVDDNCEWIGECAQLVVGWLGSCGEPARPADDHAAQHTFSSVAAAGRVLGRMINSESGPQGPRASGGDVPEQHRQAGGADAAVLVVGDHDLERAQ